MSCCVYVIFHFCCICVFSGFGRCLTFVILGLIFKLSYYVNLFAHFSVLGKLMPQVLLLCDWCHLHMFAVHCYQLSCLCQENFICMVIVISVPLSYNHSLGQRSSIFSLNSYSRTCWNRIIISESIIVHVNLWLYFYLCFKVVILTASIYWWPTEYWSNACYGAVK